MRAIVIFLLSLSLEGVLLQSVIDVYYEITEGNGRDQKVGSLGEDAKLLTLVSKPEDYSTLKYSLLFNGNAHAKKFYVGETSGDLYTAESLDRDVICAYQETDCYMEFRAVSTSELGYFFQIKVRILLIDINDNTPTFSDDIVSLIISEATEINSSFSLDGARDLDSGINGIQTYVVASKESPFEAASDTFPDGRSMLKLTVKQALDREKRSFYMVQVLAYDGGKPPNIGSLMVNVSIADVNEFPPTFTAKTYNKTIFEDHNVNDVIMTVSAQDPDGGVNGQVRYSLSPHQSSAIFDKFIIDDNTGEIKLKTSLITDSQDGYRIIVEASDRAEQPMFSQAQVFIKVLDNHNNEPEVNIDLLSSTSYAEVSEHASQGAAVAHIAVTDRDSGANGLVTCNVLNENFKIQKYEDMEYKIVVYTSLNRELHEKYNVTVRCKDAGTPPRTVYSSFTVLVLDENDNKPRFTQHNYYAHIPENNPKGVSALTVSASDLDKGRNAMVTYALSSGSAKDFDVDPVSGEITVNFVLDREVKSQYSFEILAKDNGASPMTGTATVNIMVKDVNDNAPTFSKNIYHFYVQENLAPGVPIKQIHAVDVDLEENGEIEYSFTSLTQKVSPPVWLSANGTLYTSQTLDREKIDRYDILMTARDRGNPPLQGSATITLHVIDDNDNVPVILFPTKGNNSVSISYNTHLNEIITTIKAKDNDTGLNSKLKFFTEDRNISDFFSINSLTGEISVMKQLQSSDIGRYSFEVVVQDRGSYPKLSVEKIEILVTDKLPEKDFTSYAVIAVCISVITIFLAVAIIFAIYMIRRCDQREQQTSFDKQEDSFSNKTIQEDLEAGFGDSMDSTDEYHQLPPPSYSTVVPPTPPPRRPPPIDRSISLQVSVIPENNSISSPYENPVWETGELNEAERHRHQLLYIQYQQSLLRMKTACKRSNSVLVVRQNKMVAFIMVSMTGENIKSLMEGVRRKCALQRHNFVCDI